jgi:AcrR family transcriptional regulator
MRDRYATKRGVRRIPPDILAGSAAAGAPRDRGATEWQIMDATTRVLERVPFHDLSISRVCKEAGVSRPTFYNYFPSKFAVINELLAVVLEEMIAATLPFLDRDHAEAPMDALRAGIEAATDVWVEHRLLLRVVSDHWNYVPELHEAWSRLWNRFIVITAHFIDQEREAGNAPPGADSHTLAAIMLWGAERVFYVAGLDTNPELPGEKSLVDGLVAIGQGVIYGTTADRPAKKRR